MRIPSQRGGGLGGPGPNREAGRTPHPPRFSLPSQWRFSNPVSSCCQAMIIPMIELTFSLLAIRCKRPEIAIYLFSSACCR